MDDPIDIPDDSMRHIDALLARHSPQVIQRMFAQTIESRRTSAAPSCASTNTTSTTSSSSSWRSRLSVGSAFSTSTCASDLAPAVSSTASSRANMRRTEPRSYPASFEATRPAPAVLTPASDTSSPLEIHDQSFTPTDDTSLASPTLPTDEKSQHLSGEPFMFCTYCAEQKATKTFKAKSDWKKHEMRMHETGEDWSCVFNDCNSIFDREKEFVKHLQRHHAGHPLPSLTDIGVTLLPRRVFGCGFDKCKEVSIGWDERCDHVAKHMKNGATSDQWKYSNVIRNLIRQEALHETWKEMVSCLDERLRESRSQISWCPDNTRILRQKLQCCDLRPSREEVLITALSLRSDIVLDAVHQQLPDGFVTPSRDSVAHVEKLSREEHLNILIGSSDIQQSRDRLASLNNALLQVTSYTPNYHCGSSPFAEPNSPTVDAVGSRISYMDVDHGEYLLPSIPDPLLAINSAQSHTPTNDNEHQMHSQQSSYTEQPKPPPHPLDWGYPHFFDPAPSFEESQYYARPSFGQMISKPLHKIGNRLNTVRNSSRSPHMSHSPPDMDADFTTLQSAATTASMRNLTNLQTHFTPQHQVHLQNHNPMAHMQHSHYHNPAPLHDHLHMFTTPN